MSPSPDHPAPTHAIDAALAAYLADGSVPGVAVATVDRYGRIVAREAGVRELASGRPVDGDTLFEIGSIGKSFAAAIVLQLVDEGRLALDDPVVRHLPWFRVPRTGGRITIHHLLTHTAGITAGMEGTPEATVQAWNLRHLRPGSAPGRHFHYSNVGYKVIGLIIEAIEDAPYADVVRRRILDPLGMTASEPAITNAMRDRLAVGHVAARDDVEYRPGHPLAPATWLQSGTADGSISSTATDLARWMRWLMRAGAGTADRMVDVVGAPDSDGYGYGLARSEVGGRALRSHTGGMVGYVSGMSWDIAAGAGAVVLQNSHGMAPMALTRQLTRITRAAADGDDPAAEAPDAGSWAAFFASFEPDPATVAAMPPRTAPTPEQRVLTGTYRSHDPWTPVFRVMARGEGLWLAFDAPPDGVDAAELLVPMAHGWYRVGAARLGPERLRFDLVIDGQARRAWLSGWPWYRVDRGFDADDPGSMP